MIRQEWKRRNGEEGEDDDEDDAHEENTNDRHDQRAIDDRAKTFYDVSIPLVIEDDYEPDPEPEPTTPDTHATYMNGVDSLTDATMGSLKSVPTSIWPGREEWRPFVSESA